MLFMVKITLKTFNKSSWLFLSSSVNISHLVQILFTRLYHFSVKPHQIWQKGDFYYKHIRKKVHNPKQHLHLYTSARMKNGC